MELISVIKEPYAPSKRTGNKSQNSFMLAFLVDKRANKIMIRQAFQRVFGVKVKSVNTLNKHPHPTRMTNHSRKNFTKEQKLAYISLSKEDFMALRKAIEGEFGEQKDLNTKKEVKSIPTSKESSFPKELKEIEKIKEETDSDISKKDDSSDEGEEK